MDYEPCYYWKPCGVFPCHVGRSFSNNHRWKGSGLIQAWLVFCSNANNQPHRVHILQSQTSSPTENQLLPPKTLRGLGGGVAYKNLRPFLEESRPPRVWRTQRRIPQIPNRWRSPVQPFISRVTFFTHPEKGHGFTQNCQVSWWSTMINHLQSKTSQNIWTKHHSASGMTSWSFEIHRGWLIWKWYSDIFTTGQRGLSFPT